MKFLLSTITEPAKALNAILALVVVWVALSIALFFFVSANLTHLRERDEVIRIFRENEAAQFASDAEWFRLGCETSVDALADASGGDGGNGIGGQALAAGGQG